MKPINVLQVCHIYGTGGIQTRLMDLLDKPINGFKFFIFSPCPVSEIWEKKLNQLKIPFGQATNRKTWIEEMSAFALKNHIQIAHFHQPLPLAKLALKNSGVKVIVEHDQGSSWFQAPSNIQLNYKTVDGIIALSKASKILLQKILDYNPKKIKIIYYGINFDRFKSNKPIPHPHNIKIITTICRLISLKGIDSLLKAVPTILEKRHDFEVWIVGDGPIRFELEKLADNLGIKKYVRFWGMQDEVGDFLASSDLFILPSVREPFGSVLVEAGYFSLPSIATNIDGIPEIIENEKNGLLLNPNKPFQPFLSGTKKDPMPIHVIDVEQKLIQKPQSLDPVELGQKILHLLNKPLLCRKMGQCARDRALTLFSLDRYQTEIGNFYSQLLIKKLSKQLSKKNKRP